MHRRFLSILLLFTFLFGQTHASSNPYWQYLTPEKQHLIKKIVNLGDKVCREGEDYKPSDVPTIFIPGILASWYSEYGYDKENVKRWIPDPITHSYDTLIYTFKQNNYLLKDVFYDSPTDIHIEGDPKQSLYIFGYDWKQDNRITARLLDQLITKISQDYFFRHECQLNKVNIVAHSMGGLVARSYLEDMCISEQDLQNYQKPSLQDGAIFSFSSSPCLNPQRAKVNTLVTISTPQRGSPKSLPMWEFGGIDMGESFMTSIALKSQFGEITNHQLYQSIHKYDKDIPQGIVSIGQLLPDVKNNTPYNQRLKYLYKDSHILPDSSFPVNTFLEELNKEKNINKMWDRISNKYIAYYSTVTGNDDGYFLTGNNNITSYDIAKDYEQGIPDISENIAYHSIYSPYMSEANPQFYNIAQANRNQTGLGGDGTVPTLNLRLVPNDTQSQDEVSGMALSLDTKTYKKVMKDKFESREIKCYDDKAIIKNGWKDLDMLENTLYRHIGKSWFSLSKQPDLPACSHVNMAVSSVIEVLNDISGKNFFGTLNTDEKIKKERQLLLSYIGSSDYNDEIVISPLSGPGSYDGKSATVLVGMLNTTQYEKVFTPGRYKTVLTDLERKADMLKTKINESAYVPLDFGVIDKVSRILRYDIHSPINLLITDEKGRRIGIDQQSGKIVNEIPGAWTSGDTEGSGQPEFFLIPVTGSGKVQHSIKTYATGEGGYRISVSEIETSPTQSNLTPTQSNLTPTLSLEGEGETQSSSLLLQRRGVGGEVSREGTGGELSGEQKNKISEITATAHLGYANDYQVKIDEKAIVWQEESGSLRIDVGDEKRLETEAEKFILRYSVRGQSTSKLQLKYTFNNKEYTENIDGKLELTLPKVGEYPVTLSLFESQNKKIVTKNITLTIVRKEKPLSKEEQAKQAGYTPIDRRTPEQPFLTDEIVQEYLKKTMRNGKIEPVIRFVSPK